MDLTSLKNLSAYNMSLANFLGGGKTSYFENIAQGLLQNNAQSAAIGNALTENSNANITLSPEAQQLLAQGTTDESGKATVSGVQKSGQNFLIGFFDQNGVDFSKLSDDALSLIQGLQGVIADSGTTAHDFTTDAAEEKYNPDKKVYTLTGDSARLRLAIQYGTDGKPQKLSITDITGGVVETADITLGTTNGKITNIQIDRSQKSYANGHMTTTQEMDPLTVDLYTA